MSNLNNTNMHNVRSERDVDPLSNVQGRLGDNAPGYGASTNMGTGRNLQSHEVGGHHQTGLGDLNHNPNTTGHTGTTRGTGFGTQPGYGAGTGTGTGLEGGAGLTNAAMQFNTIQQQGAGIDDPTYTGPRHIPGSGGVMDGGNAMGRGDNWNAGGTQADPMNRGYGTTTGHTGMTGHTGIGRTGIADTDVQQREGVIRRDI